MSNQKGCSTMIKFGSNCNEDMVFTIDIIDNNDNILKIKVASSEKLQQQDTVSEENPKIKKILEKANQLYPDLNNVHEITFERYILYQTRNESFCSWDDYEVRHGNTFIIFERSRLLDNLCSITDCCQLEGGEYYPGKWTHYGIYTLNHIIDVVSCNPPKIEKRNFNF